MRLFFKLSHGQLLKSNMGPEIALIRCMIKIFGDHKFRLTEVLLSALRLELPGEGSLFKSNSNKCRGPKMQPRFELSLEPLLKSGLGRLARYGTHQKTITGRPEQKYLSSDPRLRGGGALFKPACFHKFQIAYPDR